MPNETEVLTQTELLARIGGLSETRLALCVSQSWVVPRPGDDGPAFDVVDVARLQLIVDLTEDMAVNDDAVPIILSLIDQLHALRSRLRALDRAVADQDETIARAIAARLADLMTAR